MITIISFVLILGILVLIHELGHFYTARKLGVGVEEFGIGFPPRIFSFTRKGIRYSINLIPIGGFVKIQGEDGRDTDSHSFAVQKFWKKALIVSAGVIMNFILAVVLFTIVFYAGIPQIISADYKGKNISDENVVVVEVRQGSPADKVGLAVGDKILMLNDQNIVNADLVYDIISSDDDKKVNIQIKRGEELKNYDIQAEVLADSPDPKIGIGVANTGIIHYNILESIWQAITTTIEMAGLIFVALYNLVANLIRSGQLDAGLSGPVGVAVITGQIVKMGFVHILQFMAILSINLAALNILPIPALDGGRLLFIVLEKIRGKKINVAVENWIHNSGFILLILLIIFITYRDIGRYGGDILNAIKAWF